MKDGKLMVITNVMGDSIAYGPAPETSVAEEVQAVVEAEEKKIEEEEEEQEQEPVEEAPKKRSRK